jgi:succinate-semialdehyde dehydrogenase/glutarate-semialdehyde dehydrogenase
MNAAPAQPSYRVTSPVTGQVLEEFPTASDAEIEGVLARASAAQKGWAKRPVAERAAIVAAAAKLFAERADELGSLATTEMGKDRESAAGEVEFCADIFAYYADHGPALLADQVLPADGAAQARVQRLPIGPLLGVMPWNFPFYQVARFAAPNLVAGNAVIIKHAENCPTSAVAIERLLREAGLPDGVYVNVFASHDQVAGMIADPRVAGVSFTGSERGGAAVAELAGRNLKKVVLELGGSDPYIVLDTEDVAGAASAAWGTRIYNNGQACNSNKRMIVMADIYDDFVAALTAEASGLEPGDPAELAPNAFPPMASRPAAEALVAQIEDAVEQGATLHVGGSLVEGPGAYVRPAVLTGVRPGMRAYAEELFGPVAVVYRAESDEDAVRIANDSDYGLGGAVFSVDPARAAAVADALDVGMTNVNTAAGEGAALPFGGTKRSGFGRELGPLGIEEFVNKRLYYVHG